MRKSFVAAACAASVWAFVACSGDSGGSTASPALDPVEACKESTQITCDKLFKCFTKAELTQLYGFLDTDECLSFGNAGCTPAKTNCPDGGTYHADNAKACNDEYRALTCSALRSPDNKLPAVCDQRCTK